MTAGTGDAKKQRAEARERRRARTASGAAQEPETEALHAARTAATAAAVGAAVGAVRALADRRSDGTSERPEPDALAQPDADDEPEPDVPDAEAAPAPSADEAHERHGATPDEAGSVVRTAREHLRDLHGSEPESVSSLEQTAGGWVVTLEVLEVRRVPDSTDLLGTYRVELDDDGNLLGFRRTGRYYRAQADSREET